MQTPRHHRSNTIIAQVRRNREKIRSTSVGNSYKQTYPHPHDHLNRIPIQHQGIQHQTKLAELQVFKPEDTKQIPPIDAAALKTLEDLDDTHMYVKEREERFWFPHLKIQ